MAAKDHDYNFLDLIFGAFFMGVGGFIAFFGAKFGTSPLIFIGAGLLAFGAFIVIKASRDGASS